MTGPESVSAYIAALSLEHRAVLEQLRAQGQLARGDLGGLNIALPGFSWATVLWPHGWTARLGDDNRVELFDGQGAFVAREWDEVEIGGRGDSNDFQACDGAVSVIQPFPLSPE